MKKLTGLALIVLVAGSVFAGARQDSGASSGSSASSGGGNIIVISREDGSGTRSAFTELFEVLDSNKKDAITPQAEITNNTAVMMTSVAGEQNAIGYISLGSLNDTVKALSIDGITPSAATAASGEYKITRPFYIATKGEVKAAAQDFIAFIMSRNGQDVIAANGYVRRSDTGAFTSAMPSGRVIVAGSSSVTPVMEKLKEAYAKLNPGVSIEVQQSDSSTGMNATIDGICDIGMASRDLKDTELEKGLSGTVIAIDGIAVIVNKANPLNGLTRDQVKTIYLGQVGSWSAVSR
ncbi:MAG: substrate-binding domain-containing protein [Treponema sp.]|jgi:phosphate transport system substrate-binding protein|nr:substrate-binding domain-containing protein [Treponema sp.]